MKQQAFTLERTFDAPIHILWEALTNKAEMKKWYFDLAEFKAELNFEFQFTGGHEDGIQYVHLCKVTEVIPDTKITYSWRYDGYPGISYVTFELFAKGEQTQLILTHAGLESFDQANPDFAAKNFAEGWNQIINSSLLNYIGELQK